MIKDTVSQSEGHVYTVNQRINPLKSEFTFHHFYPLQATL